MAEQLNQELYESIAADLKLIDTEIEKAEDAIAFSEETQTPQGEQKTTLAGLKRKRNLIQAALERRGFKAKKE